MATPNRARLSIWLAAIVLLIAMIASLSLHYPSSTATVPPNKAYLLKLESANHYKSENPAPGQTIDLAKTTSLRIAALNAIGRELRDVHGLETGDPETVFFVLSHLGGFGEIIWVDNWSNFPVKLPPSSTPGLMVIPRHDAVMAALDAIDASGGCLIKAGENRYLVAKTSEKKEYEAAIQALGWLNGSQPPWVKPNSTAP